MLGRRRVHTSSGCSPQLTYGSPPNLYSQCPVAPHPGSWRRASFPPPPLFGSPIPSYGPARMPLPPPQMIPNPMSMVTQAISTPYMEQPVHGQYPPGTVIYSQPPLSVQPYQWTPSPPTMGPGSPHTYGM